MNTETDQRWVVQLANAVALPTNEVGSKAGNLARLSEAGFPVPAGFVVTSAAFGNWDRARLELAAAARVLGDGPLAVRSSASAEDLAEASFAGQYETFLGVERDGLEAAVLAVRESARSARVAAYQARQAALEPAVAPDMAVLVQSLVRADSAGVAFSADPLTGARDETVVTAVRGLGERLVSGEATGDTWVVRGGTATASRLTEKAIGASDAVRVAELADRVEQCFGAPVDIEWAITGDTLFLLQARLMTALPQPVKWNAPGPGYWVRNVHLGEWLPEPVTPLFESWLLERLEEGFTHGERETAGTVMPFGHAVINGWYYATLTPRLTPVSVLRALLEGRGRLLRVVVYGLARPITSPDVADRAILRELETTWREQLLPRYRTLVERGTAQVETASEADLVVLVDSIGLLAGEQLWSLAIVGGSAWKMEGALARFFHEHLASRVEGSVQTLLSGLADEPPSVEPHLTQSADWYRATAGELGWADGSHAGSDRRTRLIGERRALEDLCRAALADRPKVLDRFERFLTATQHYARVREEQARSLTIGWPLLRRCALRLGETLHANGVIADANDVFFLTRDELASRTSLNDAIHERRVLWERRRRLTPPLAIGRPPRAASVALRSAVDAVRGTATAPEAAIVGQPASPGRATGPARILRGPEDFERLRDGDVLVASTTTPGWTPLFARAAAIVTDGGTLAAHASLVAREYGIPAVVATGDATRRLSDGELILVDGSAGIVVRRDEAAS
jgi:pyruvate,water dikinase